MSQPSKDHQTINIDGYSIHRLIGKGGMAYVYEATQESLGRKVAIKVLNESLNDEFSERFIREGKIIATLNNRNVITVYDIAKVHDGRYYIAMEYLEGGDLQKNSEQKLPSLLALKIIKQVAEALSVVHRNGIVHRDIKPANILFRKDGTVVLSDFGIAKHVESKDSDLTQVGTALGSPSYSSPEQATSKPIDHRSDLYSLGVVLLQLLTGKNPFKGDSYTETVVNHMQMEIPQLSPPNDKYQRFIERLLAKDPTERPDSADEVCMELTSFIKQLEDSGNNRDIQVDSNPEQNSKTQILKLGVYAVVACALLLLGLFFGFVYESETDKKIKAIIAQAEAATKSGNLISPEQESAGYYYKQILLLDDENEIARSGLRDIIEYTLVTANIKKQSNQLVEPDKDNAVYFYQKVLSFSPKNDEAKAGLQEIIENLLTQAQIRFNNDRLSKPERDNAYYFYQQVLLIEQDNQPAKVGVSNILSRFFELVEQSARQGRYAKAHALIDRALEVDPHNEQFQALKKQIRKPNVIERFIEIF